MLEKNAIAKPHEQDNEIVEEGFAIIKIGDAKILIDLWKENNLLVDLRSQYDEDETAFHEAVLGHMVSLGYPVVSHQTASKWAIKVHELTGTLQKKDGSEATE